ncbi:MAG: hypothetical protein H0U74_06635 [Bradymonadaceae bacterium]|nr:hypothetical protein [Lujinxingiaceae bacterium]
MLETLSMFASYFVLAQLGSFSWTVETFYIAAGVVHLVVILLGFRLMHLEPEYNTFIGALMAAVISNGVAYLLKDFGLFGVLGSGATFFVMLVVISHADVLKALIMWAVVLAAYALMAFLIIPRADGLNIEQIAGLPQVMMTGGLKAEPFTDESYDNLSKGKKN